NDSAPKRRICHYTTFVRGRLVPSAGETDRPNAADRRQNVLDARRAPCYAPGRTAGEMRVRTGDRPAPRPSCPSSSRYGTICMNFLKWLQPGLHVKRWLLFLLLGITLLSLGIAYLLVSVYREQPFPGWVYYATLQFLERPLRAALFIALAIGCIV